MKPAAAMLKHGLSRRRLRISGSLRTTRRDNGSNHTVLTCITPRSSDPSALGCTAPGLPPSTAWIVGSTRGGRWYADATTIMQAINGSDIAIGPSSREKAHRKHGRRPRDDCTRGHSARAIYRIRHLKKTYRSDIQQFL